MDPTTHTFLLQLNSSPPIPRIKAIYAKFKDYDHEPLTLEVVTAIYSAVVDTFYTNLNEYLAVYKKRLPVNIHDTRKGCADVDSLLEAKEYDETDREFDKYDYGLDIPLTCINSLNDRMLFYSGGYLTKSRVIFIILMILHEIIHIIEYTDSRLTKSKNEHTVFFYNTGFKIFGQLSRLSEIIEDNTYINFSVTDRIHHLKRLEKKRPGSDGADLLNDHSHYINNDGKPVLLGYIAYTSLVEASVGAGKRTTRRSRR